MECLSADRALPLALAWDLAPPRAALHCQKDLEVALAAPADRDPEATAKTETDLQAGTGQEKILGTAQVIGRLGESSSCTAEGLAAVPVPVQVVLE